MIIFVENTFYMHKHYVYTNAHVWQYRHVNNVSLDKKRISKKPSGLFVNLPF